MIDTQLNRLSVLAHADRLSVFRLLVRRLPETVPAGEIARSLSLKPSTLSAHLSALQNAGLASHSRQGTTLLYRADLDGAESLVSFLFEDCCRGRADLCQPRHPAQSSPGNILKEKRFSVLFICSGNSTRSIIAETLLRAEAGDRFIAYSAGTRPRSEINPATIRFLRSKGHDTTALRAKHVSEFQGPEAPALDFVFTVCDRAANEECPPWPGQPVTAHWGLPDPNSACGTDAERTLAFQQTYGMIRNRITGLAALPVETLDRMSLQAAIDRIPGKDNAR
jgi:arsenate reductase